MASACDPLHADRMVPRCGHGHAQAGGGEQSNHSRASLAATATSSDAASGPVEEAVPMGAEVSASRRRALGSVVAAAAAAAAAATALPAHAMKTVRCTAEPNLLVLLFWLMP